MGEVVVVVGRTGLEGEEQARLGGATSQQWGWRRSQEEGELQGKAVDDGGQHKYINCQDLMHLTTIVVGNISIPTEEKFLLRKIKVGHDPFTTLRGGDCGNKCIKIK